MSSVVDEILEVRGVDYDDLTEDEKKTYFKWLADIEKSVVTVDTAKQHIRSMKSSVELELVKTDPYTYFLWFRIPNRKHALLTARLHNYILLDALFDQPERAKQALESYKHTSPVKL